MIGGAVGTLCLSLRDLMVGSDGPYIHCMKVAGFSSIIRSQCSLVQAT